MKNFKLCLIAAIGLTGLALAGNAATAMPMASADSVAAQAAPATPLLQEVYLVCGPYRCFRRGYGYGYRRPFFGYGYGYRHYGYRY